jgi:hypothetical protein
MYVILHTVEVLAKNTFFAPYFITNALYVITSVFTYYIFSSFLTRHSYSLKTID